MRKRTRLLGTLAVAGALVITACGGDDDDDDGAAAPEHDQRDQ